MAVTGIRQGFLSQDSSEETGSPVGAFNGNGFYLHNCLLDFTKI